ncbi:MAG TPA: hypothetical protein VKM94_11390 [Blastocatellia bacterium]|nr:hypothetical protein [Blastocatellia bacterium]
MSDLQVVVGGQTLTFLSTGDVSVLSGDQQVKKGKWSSDAPSGASPANQLTYDIDGTAQTPLPVNYAFTATNQLSVTAGSAQAVYAGAIEIDDNHDVVYTLIDGQGNTLTQRFTVYGDLSFDKATNDIAISLTGGGKTQITGASGIQSIEALKNNIAAFRGDDLLQFNAFTENQLTDGSTLLSPANIQFTGNWDFKGGQLVFVSKVQGDITRPDIELGFAGTVKGITAGFAYFTDDKGTSLAFNIAGQHTWNSGNTNWDVSLGYTQKTFTATIDGKLQQKIGTGQEFTISGHAQLTLKDGAPMKLDLEINATYQWTNQGTLVFTAKVSEENNELNYNLQLEGNFKFAGGVLSFQIKFSGGAPSDQFQLQLAFTGGPTDIVKTISLVLNVSPDKVDLSFQFELRMTWVDGVLVKGDPKPIAA